MVITTIIIYAKRCSDYFKGYSIVRNYFTCLEVITGTIRKVQTKPT